MVALKAFRRPFVNSRRDFYESERTDFVIWMQLAKVCKFRGASFRTAYATNFAGRRSGVAASARDCDQRDRKTLLRLPLMENIRGAFLLK